VPLLALFGGAAFWLVVSSVLAMIASINFMRRFSRHCPWLTYGRVQPAPTTRCFTASAFRRTGCCAVAVRTTRPDAVARSNRAGRRGKTLASGVLVVWLAFCPATAPALRGLNFARQFGHLFSLFAAGAVGDDEFRRPPRTRAVSVALVFSRRAVLVFVDLLDGHLFLVAWPVRGVVQAVIGWWFVGNLLFVWLALVELARRFISCQNSAGRPLQSYYLALFAFWTLILSDWCGIPPGAPVAGLAADHQSYAAIITVVPVLAVGVIMWQPCAVEATPRRLSVV